MNGLDLHAEAFDGGENAGDVIDDGDGGADGHAKQLQNMRVSGGGEQHHRADHRRAQNEHDGGVDDVIEIRALHGGVALADAAVVAPGHVVLETEGADGADVVQGLRHLAGDGGNGAAVIKLGRQHPLLHMAGKDGQQGQDQQEHQGKPRILHRDDREDGQDTAGVRRHGDDAGGEEGFRRVHVAGEARGDLAGVLRGEHRSRQAGQLGGQLRAQGVGHFLSKDLHQRFLCRGQHALQSQRAEVEQRRRKDQRGAAGQRVDDAAQQQRRQEGGEHRRRRAQDGPCAEQLAPRRRASDGGEHAAFCLTLHVRHLPSGFRRAPGRPGIGSAALHGCPRWFFRPP